MELSSSETGTHGGMDNEGKESQLTSSLDTLNSASSSSNNDKKGLDSHNKTTDGSRTALNDIQYQETEARPLSPTPSDRLEKEYEENCLELWDAAYDSLKADDPALLAKYEEKLTRKAAPAFRWANWSHKDGYLTPNIISQIDPKTRRRQMSQIVFFWLDYLGNESADLELRDEDLDYWPKLKSKYFCRIEWIGQIIRGRKISYCSPQSDIALLASCLAAESIYESADLSDQFSQGVVHIISCLKWYNALPKLLLLTGGEFRITDHNENLRNDILELYKAVLLYQIRVVCLHLNSALDETIASNMKEPEYKHIVDAQNDLWSFGDYDTYDELFYLFPISQKDDKKGIEAVLQEAQANTKEEEKIDPLLEDLHAVEPFVMNRKSNMDEDPIFASLDRYISSHPHFRSFCTKDDVGPQLLGIKGNPGSGKTLLMLAAVRQLSTKLGEGSLTGIVVSYFCGKNHIDSENLLSILKSLIWQMIRERPSLMDHLRSAYSMSIRETFDHPNDYRAMSTILHCILQGYKDNVYVVVDSIDECRHNELHRLLDLILTTTKLSSKVKWIVSFAEVDFRGPTVQFKRKAECRIDPTHAYMQAAMEQYTSSKLDKLIGDKKCDEQFRDQLRLKIQTRCQGNFLWVDLACEEISRHDLWNALVLLDRLPENLQALFVHIKNRLASMDWEDPKYCEDVFLAVTTAFRPLSLAELSDIVALPVQVDLAEILKKCSAFFTIHERTIYFRCRSARQFLREQVKYSLSHLTLARLSLRCLLRWCKDPTRSKLPSHYIALYWIKHSTYAIQLRTEDDEFVNLIEDFLWSYTRQWTKLLVSFSSVSRASGLILELEKAMEIKFNVIGYSNKVLRLIREVHEYLSLHHTVESSAKFGAKTNIIFGPSTSKLREKILTTEFPWLKTGPMPEIDWTIKQDLFPFTGYFCYWELSPDGQLAAASDHRTIYVWDVDSGKTQQVIDYDYSTRIVDIAISSHGLLAVACQDKLDVWDINTGLPESIKLPVEKSEMKHISFSNGTRLAAVTNTATIVWNIPKFGETRWAETRWTDYSNATCIVFSPDNKILALTTENKIVLLGLSKGSKIRVLEEPDSDPTVCTMAFSPDMKFLATVDSLGSVRLWNLDSRKIVNVLKGSSTKSRPLIFLPDGLHLAFNSDEGAIVFWRFPWDEKECTMEQRLQDLSWAHFSANGQYLLSNHRIWDLKTTCEHAAADNHKVSTSRLFRQHSSTVKLLVFSDDGSLVATSDSSGSIYLWDGNTGEFKSTLFTRRSFYRGLTSVMFSHDGNWLIFTFDDSRIFLASIITNEKRVLLGHEDSLRCAALSHCGRFLVSASDDMTVRLWDLSKEEGDILTEEQREMCEQGPHKTRIDSKNKVEEKSHSQVKLDVHETDILCVAVTDDAQYVAAGADDGSIQLWWLSNDKVVLESTTPQLQRHHKHRVVSVAFLPNGAQLVSSSDDHTLKVWSAATRSLIRSISIDRAFHRLRIDLTLPGFVMTERGPVSIDPLASPSADESEVPDSCPYAITPDGSWITWKNRELIFLPEDYRPDAKGPSVFSDSTLSTITAIHGHKVVIGCQSGQVIFFKFDEDAQPFGL